MFKLLAVIAVHFAEVMCPVWAGLIPIFFLFLAGFYLNDVDGNSNEKFCSLGLVPIITVALLLFILAGFFKGFKLVFKSSTFLRLSFLGPSV